MIIKKSEIRKYLRYGCVIKRKNGDYVVVREILTDYIVNGFGTGVFFEDIEQIVKYEIPADIETNREYVGHYFKMKCDGSKHYGYWFNGEWGRIKKIESYMAYKITFDYLNKKTNNGKPETACSKNEIDVYNPFCPEPIIVEEAILNEAPERREFKIDDNANKNIPGTMLTDAINTKLMLQYNHMKKIVGEMMGNFEEPIEVKSFNGQIVKDIFGFENKSKQRLNFDILLNEQKITLDQYN
jgi:hypothetical protein